MNEFITSLITKLHMFPVWGLVLFSFLSACIQQIFPPYPSEVLLLVLGGLAAAEVILGPAAIIPYIIGTVVSSLALFYISRRFGKTVLKNKYVRKIFSRRNQFIAGRYMRRYGSPALAICKFLPGINTVCLIIGGVMGLRGAVPAIAIIGSAIAENAVYYFAGKAIGVNMPSIYSFTKNFSFGSAIVIGAVVFIYLIIKFVPKLIRMRKKAAR